MLDLNIFPEYASALTFTMIKWKKY